MNFNSATDRVLSGEAVESVLSEVIDVAKADTAKGLWYKSPNVVSFDFTVEGEPYVLHFVRMFTGGRSPGQWSVAFSHRVKGQKRVGKGIAGPVFREVIGAAKKFIDDHRERVAELLFTAADPGLEKFYKVIVPRLAKELGHRWDEEQGTFTVFLSETKP
jgi:hypothetical protein